jgi:hypothetical protein
MGKVDEFASASLAGAISRREHPRLDAPVDLQVRVPALRGPVSPLNVSAGGLAVLASDPLIVGSKHTVELTLGAIRVHRRVRVVHCRLLRNGRWATGLQFVSRASSAGRDLADLLAAVKARSESI